MLTWGAFLTALLTGLFCSVFAVVVDAILDMAGVWMVAAVSMISGFLGSLFAQLTTGRGRK
ncbi:hypothetical protein [Roseovarius salinarum]|uniref:hypothetical protein n=1 Tax=Roseovarius salinarum TaxID=1981892 RepID=UPI000C324890|nr:hypothetical protein [Roseovarius salinarum]